MGGFLNIEIDAVQQGALHDHQTVQLLVDLVELMD